MMLHDSSISQARLVVETQATVSDDASKP